MAIVKHMILNNKAKEQSSQKDDFDVLCKLMQNFQATEIISLLKQVSQSENNMTSHVSNKLAQLCSKLAATQVSTCDALLLNKEANQYLIIESVADDKIQKAITKQQDSLLALEKTELEEAINGLAEEVKDTAHFVDKNLNQPIAPVVNINAAALAE